MIFNGELMNQETKKEIEKLEKLKRKFILQRRKNDVWMINDYIKELKKK